MTKTELREDLITALQEFLNLQRHLIKYERALASIRENTQCIGLDKAHVDGNCIHCTATFIRPQIKMKNTD